MLEATPSDGTLRFTGEEVVIRFDEGLSETNPSEHVVVTPIPTLAPTVTADGSELKIRFREPLLKDRTYAVTVGAGLQDRAGNRIGRPTTIRFATGDRFDSGAISGRVDRLLGRSPFVFAWADQYGSPFAADTLRPPDMIAPVGDDGVYRLEGIPAGTYRLAVVDDVRRDRLFTPGTDAIGVGPTGIDVENTPVGPFALILPPAPEDRTSPLLYRARPISTVRTDLQFSEPIDSSDRVPGSFSIEIADEGPIEIDEVWSSDGSVVSLRHQPVLNGLPAIVRVGDIADTAGNRLADTTRSAPFTGTDRIDTSGPVIRLRLPSHDLLIVGRTFLIDTDEPSEHMAEFSDIGTVTLADTGSSESSILPIEQLSATSYLVRIPPGTKRGDARRLTINGARFIDRSGYAGTTTLDTIIAVVAEPQVGTVLGRLVDSTAPGARHIVIVTGELGDRFERIVEGEGSWEFADIPSGSYRLEAIRDVNGNGRLDYGVIDPTADTWEPAERSVQVPGGIRVRPRWTTTDTVIEF